MRRATDKLFVRDPINLIIKTVTVSTLLVSGIVFLSKKSVAIENNSTRITVMEVKNAVQDTSITDLKETLKVLAYLGCAQARRNDPSLALPAECNKVISMPESR